MQQCNINMNQKQNNKYVLDRLYPEYFKQLKQPSGLETIDEAVRNHRTKQDKKIESKLKTIIYNLEREIQEQAILSRPRLRRNDTGSISENAQTSSRSYSLKLLGPSQRIHKYKTQSQAAQLSQNGQRTQIIKRFRKHSQSKHDNRQHEQLSLPKIKTKNNQIIEHPYKKQLLHKKKSKKLEKLDEKDRQLGKIVLEKVEKHFQMEKQGKNRYYERVKSEQGIDQSFLTYLRNKVKKANVVLER